MNALFIYSPTLKLARSIQENLLINLSLSRVPKYNRDLILQKSNINVFKRPFGWQIFGGGGYNRDGGVYYRNAWSEGCYWKEFRVKKLFGIILGRDVASEKLKVL